MNARLLYKYWRKKNTIFIYPYKEKNLEVRKNPENSSLKTDINNIRSTRVLYFLNWIIENVVKTVKWFLKHFFKIITTILTALLIWLLSFFNIKLPNLPFLPIPTQSTKQEEKKQDQKQDDRSKPSEQPTKIITITNTITQTNIVAQTNYINQIVYVTNFIIQPIVVTNTVYKEVPITVTNILVIKNYSNNNSTNKNSLQNGPAYFLSDDLNTLIQNQTQNPVRGQLLN